MEERAGNTIEGSREISPTLSADRYKAMLDAVDGIVWEADAATFEFTFVSDSVARILGYMPEEWLGSPHFWTEHIHPDDREYAVRYCHYETQLARNHTFDYRMIKADGSLIWIKDVVSVVVEEGSPRWLRGIMVDVTETRLHTELDRLEKEVLELNAQKDSDTETVLTFYVQGMEKLFPHMKCSVMRISDDRGYSWVSPSLPEAYTTAINDQPAGPYAGSCGAAVYSKSMVIVNDIEHDEIWKDYKDFALSHGLRACWSYPIIDSQDNVIATFGIYYTTVMSPDISEISLITRAAAILKIILENRHYAQMVQEANALIAQGESLANLGTWQWDIDMNKIVWSDVLYHIYGVRKGEFVPTLESLTGLIHPEDVEKVRQNIQSVLASGKGMISEDRIICPDGEVKYLKTWTQLITGENNRPVKMIGACLDITKAKTTQEKMEKIAWMQSHVIRAPLARLLGLVYLLQEEKELSKEHQELLNGIVSASHELDNVIRDISDNSLSY